MQLNITETATDIQKKSVSAQKKVVTIINMWHMQQIIRRMNERMELGHGKHKHHSLREPDIQQHF